MRGLLGARRLGVCRIIGERRAGARRPAGDRGQSAIEFLGVLPFLLLLIVAALQLFYTLYTVNATDTAARAAARAESLGGSPQQAAADALPSFLRGSLRSVNYPARETVTVSVEVPVLFPGLSLPAFHVDRSASMPMAEPGGAGIPNVLPGPGR